ncbi:hypothetical protein FSP39_005355 [Pinctada imbricata]|uniref:Uncharacterized protein n=1 Tax=Pinctada imbricata TaxID=66713 RepID=A0AA88YD12_PINIB|nr:hypothetical protein FSP39_005355 [Pinctada imbricata]
MNLGKTKLYKTILSGNPEQVMKSLWEYLKTGKDVNIKDENTGGNLLHLLVEHGQRFCSPETVQAIYMLVCKDIDIDAQDNHGDTGLHICVRIPGTYRIMMALLRCGIDTRICNNDGKTAEEVLLKDRPEGWEEMLHWYYKFKPGLWAALSEDVPDRKLVERLLKNWCRLTCVKNGKTVRVKSLVENDIQKVDLLHLLEKYENSNEMCLALNAGFGFIVKSWFKQGVEVMNGVDCNAKDHSYQHAFPDFPEVPRPLLAAAWESNNFEAVDVLMDMNPDTRVLWTNEKESINAPKPIFFHHVTCTGKTARDIAVKRQKQIYYKCIDEYIIKLVKDRKCAEIEKLILHNYDHILDITDSSGKKLVDIAKRHGNQAIHEVVRLTAAIQAYVRRIFVAVDKGNLEEVKKLLSCKKYADSRDRCGRTLLHRAILRKQKEVALHLMEACPNNMTIGDTLDRTPFHYARLFLPEESFMKAMREKGADEARTDSFGRTPTDFTPERCGNQVYKKLQDEISSFDLNVYLAEKDFDETLKTAIQSGDIEMVKSLVSGLQAFGDGSRFSNALFECIDQKQIEIAKYLIMNGFKTDIYKQYSKCDPNDPMCAMMECGHSMTSLKDRAIEKKCDEIVKLMEQISLGKVGIIFLVRQCFKRF